MLARIPPLLLVVGLLLATPPLSAKVCRQDNFDKATAVSERLTEKQHELNDLLLRYVKDAQQEFFAKDQRNKHLTQQGLITWERQAGRSLDEHTDHMVARRQRLVDLRRRLSFLEDNLPGAQNLWQVLIKYCRQEGYPDRVDVARHNGRVLDDVSESVAQNARSRQAMIAIYGEEVDLLRQAQQAHAKLEQQAAALQQAKAATQAAATKPNASSTASDAPCTCVFNKNRTWNPEKINWKGGVWKCNRYADDGYCHEVIRTGDAK